MTLKRIQIKQTAWELYRSQLFKHDEERMSQIGKDFKITNDGNIRHIQGTTVYHIVELHRCICEWVDTNYFNLNIMPMVSDRLTDNIIELNGGLNITDIEADFLTGGFIFQLRGETRQVYVSLDDKIPLFKGADK